MSTKKALKLKCKVSGCNRPHHAQGYCQDCYDELRKKKKAGKVKVNSNGKKAATAPSPAPVKAKEPKELSKEKDKKQHDEPVQELPQIKTKGRKGKALPGTKIGEITNPGEEPAKLGRLGLIKTRHEAMKREIDQIREDLESEEEE